jgi:Tat protein secretion system quality control protein TatD with DNase activity
MTAPTDSVVPVDTQCSLADPHHDEDREAMIERAVAPGVRAMVRIGAGGPALTNEVSLTTARDEPTIVVAVGIHPHDVAGAHEADYDQLRALARLCLRPTRYMAEAGRTRLDSPATSLSRSRSLEAVDYLLRGAGRSPVFSLPAFSAQAV